MERNYRSLIHSWPVKLSVLFWNLVIWSMSVPIVVNRMSIGLILNIMMINWEYDYLGSGLWRTLETVAERLSTQYPLTKTFLGTGGRSRSSSYNTYLASCADSLLLLWLLVQNHWLLPHSPVSEIPNPAWIACYTLSTFRLFFLEYSPYVLPNPSTWALPL